MGLFDLLTGSRGDVSTARRALDEARDPTGDTSAITRLIQQVLAIGIDGRGPFASAVAVAEKARATHGSTEDAIDALVGLHLRGGAAGGFVTSLGGFVTMVAAVPANVFEFYVQATRMVAGVAHLRGHDVNDPEIRTAVLLTLVGSNSAGILAKAGINLSGGTLSQLASRSLPKAAVMVLEKAIGFRILRGVGERALARLGKAIPVAGGLIGAGVDWAMMRGIAQQARHEFPEVVRSV